MVFICVENEERNTIVKRIIDTFKDVGFDFWYDYSRVIIHDRDHITFVLGNAGDISTIKTMDDDILVQEEIYYIRKMKHKFHYGIYIK